MANIQERVQALTEEYRKLEQDLQNSVQALRKLESQHKENKNVQKEFAILKDDANIYKLVGPVLLKQDKVDAVLAVDSRLEFIEKEIKRIEKQIADLQEKGETKKMEIIQIQSVGQGQVQIAA